MEDEIAALQTVTYNAQEICDQLGEFVRLFPSLSDGERRLVVDSLIIEVALNIQPIFNLDGCYCNNHRALAKLSPAGSAKEHMSEQDLAKPHQIRYSYK